MVISRTRLGLLFVGLVGGASLLVFADVPATAPSTQAAGQLDDTTPNKYGWTKREEVVGGRLRMLGVLIAGMTDDRGHMPADIGMVLHQVEMTHKEAAEEFPGREELNNEQMKALYFLEPGDVREIPEYPDRKWVNENTAWVYTGSAKILAKKVPEWGSVLILHEKLEGANLKRRRIVLAFLDGHAELATPEDAAKRIEESKKILAKAEADSGGN